MITRQSSLLVLWFPGISRYDFAIDAGAGVFTCSNWAILTSVFLFLL
jgi:hypothetical protein